MNVRRWAVSHPRHACLLIGGCECERAPGRPFRGQNLGVDMAIRTATSAEPGSRRGLVAVAILLVVIFAAALFLRTYWNVDAAVENGHFVLSSGSDPYYEKRAIDSVQAHNFHTLIFDPLLNYPYGAVNPNPPLYQWSVAVAGHVLAPLFPANPAGFVAEPTLSSAGVSVQEQ